MSGQELQERDQAGVLDRLPFNLTQLLAFAMQKPRDPLAAMDNAIAQLRAAPQFASKAYYVIPFRNKDGSTTNVEGPSIKAATALTGCWGNNIEGAFIGEETDQYIDVSGYFFDYETGKLTIRPFRVSKTYKTQDGKVLPWRKDMLDKQLAAGVSKAVRNADLNGLPAGYVAEYYAEAKRIAARGGKLPPTATTKGSGPDDLSAITKQITACVTRFGTLGVDDAEVKAYVNRHPELVSEEDVAAHLIGILNALDEQQTTIDEVFTAPTTPISEPQRAAPAAPAAKPAPTARKLPDDRRRMQSRIDGVACKACGKKIAKGVWIWRNEASASWEHEVCPK